jgi:dTDP-4-dehydrorhamnose 3,5-epimerase-like enzyme
MIPNVKRHVIKFHEDDRAQRLQDVYQVGMKDTQINISYVNSTEHCVGWHYHTKQTEYWFVVKGALKVGLVKSDVQTDEEKNKKDVVSGKVVGVEFEYLSDKNLQVLEIPPFVYHGYRALIPETILMYYITEKYEEVSKYDDERVPIGYFGEDWGTPNK